MHEDIDTIRPTQLNGATVHLDIEITNSVAAIAVMITVFLLGGLAMSRRSSK